MKKIVRLCLCSVSDSPGLGRSPSGLGVVVCNTSGADVEELPLVTFVELQQKRKHICNCIKLIKTLVILHLD